MSDCQGFLSFLLRYIKNPNMGIAMRTVRDNGVELIGVKVLDVLVVGVVVDEVLVIVLVEVVDINQIHSN